MRRFPGLLAAASLAFGAAPALAGQPAEGLFPAAKIQALADTGAPEAMATLGWMYETGRTVAVDDAKAVNLYRAAMARGDAFATWRMGVMIDAGRAEGTLEQAVTLFRKGAAASSPGATASLGMMYATGRGVERDYEASMRYYQAAALLGSAHGLEGIGVLYANGQGVERDMAEALAYWMAAAAGGDTDATELLLRYMPPSSDPAAAPILARADQIADRYGIGVGREAQAAADDDGTAQAFAP